MVGRLEGKKAVVVGAGQQPGEDIGNGRAIALLFAREGAEVLCVDRERDRADETVAAIVGAGGQASAFEADIVGPGQAAAILAAAQQRMGRVDILINNVGIGFVGPGGDGPAAVADETAFERTMNVNVTGMWLTIKAALPVMGAEGGAIVNISSIEAASGHGLLAYEISKAAVNRLTTAVAMSAAPQGIRCNAIMPGLMRTPLAMNTVTAATGLSFEQVRAQLDARVPLKGGMGTAWDTARAALFLASDDARFITGVLLPVDGGALARVG
ncbi:MAG TPA: SDR family oxidoreductase [Caulobacteraceae bacterium]|nr:SDR family oxidoreductase [Caulobacteraceae bacterium]